MSNMLTITMTGANQIHIVLQEEKSLEQYSNLLQHNTLTQFLVSKQHDYESSHLISYA